MQLHIMQTVFKIYNDSASAAWIVTTGVEVKMNCFLRFSTTSLYSSCIAQCEFSAMVTLTLQNHILLVPREKQAAPFFVHRVHVCGRQIVLGWLELRNLSFTTLSTNM